MELLQEVELLRKVPMFSKLEPSKLKLLAFTSESVSFDDGEILFQVGDPGDCAYVIMTGEVDILTETDAGEIVAGTLKRNQLFGELALLNSVGRASTLRAKGHLEALRIKDDVFLKLLRENPDVALDVMRQLSEKLALSHRRYEMVQAELARYESGQS